MVQRTETDGAAERGRRGPARAWSLLVDGLAALGTLMICVLMLIICADVVARNLMGASLPLVSELGALVLVMIVYLQLATTVRADRLARTEIFYFGFRRSYPRAGAWLGAIFDAVGAVVIAGIAWSTINILSGDLASREFIGVTGVATLPVWPFRALILTGVTVAAIEFALRVWAEVRRATARAGA